MQLTVVIPCYNAADTIAIQLEALARQEFSQPWELIVADNGSTDGTQAIAEKYADQFTHFRLVDASAQRGAAHGRNVGVSVAQSDAIVFCDADDEVAPGWLSAMAEALKRHDLVTGCLDYWKLNPDWLVRGCGREKGTGVFESGGYLPFASSSNLGVKRAVHDAVGGFDESLLLLQDVDYSWRIQQTGVKLHYVPKGLIHYRLRGSLTGVCHRAFRQGSYEPLLYSKHRSSGMPSLFTWKTFIKTGLLFPWQLVRQARDRATLCKVLMDCCWRFGELYGCVKYRYLPL